ncbi:MAG: lysine--tRNA ligase [Armatimonadota bacterium]|jgi:lysyl-tRNA synthetase class 2
MSETSEQHELRQQKLAVLKERGQDPFETTRYDRTHCADEIRANFDRLDGSTVRIAGRLLEVRDHGKVRFADLVDGSGSVQLYARKNDLGDEAFAAFTDMDRGDIVGVTGRAFRTRAGEVTVAVEQFQLLAKALRPLPKRWHGLRDVELRSRQRYADLLANPESRELFVKRSEAISAVRRLMDDRGYIEVETPMMHPIPGGALARPFVTHHNTLDMALYMRIAPELYLKRLIVGGLEKVYEIGRVFRNEGISPRHNPEYTLLESYEAYADYEDMMTLVEAIINCMAEVVCGGPKFVFRGEEIDVTPPWPRVQFMEAITDRTGVDMSQATDDESARELAAGLEIDLEQRPTLPQILDGLFDRYIVHEIMQPTFVVDYPTIISPLAKRKPGAPRLAERFEPIIGRMEMGNAFSELNDPDDQRERFLEQARMHAAGDEEAHRMDEDYIRALEYGMPPTGGIGLGMDRLLMLMTDAENLREVILFPLLRPVD